MLLTSIDTLKRSAVGFVVCMIVIQLAFDTAVLDIMLAASACDEFVGVIQTR